MPPLKKSLKAYINDRVGAKGLNVLDPSHVIGDFQTVRQTNATPTRGGSKSRYGFSVFTVDNTKTGGIPLIHGFNKSDGTKQLVFANDDDYYQLPLSAVKTDAWNLIGDYGNVSDKLHAYTFDDFVIFGTGLATNVQKKYDGTTLTNVTTPATPRDLGFFEFFQGQDFAALFGAGDANNPSRLYFSAPNDPDDWGSPGGFIDISKNDGFKITGLRAQNDQLIVYKERNRYYVSTFFDSVTGVFGIKVLPFVDNSGGSVEHGTIQVLKNGDIVSLAGESEGVQGVGKLQAADGSLVPKQYSRDILTIFDQFNWDIIEKARGIVYDSILWLAVPFGKAATTNTAVVRYHIDEEAWDFIPDLAIASWANFVDDDNRETLYAGSATSPQIFKWDKNTFTDDGAKITTIVKTGRINLGSISDVEEATAITFEGFKNVGDELKVTVIVDGIQSSYLIDDNFLVTSGSSSGYLSSDVLATEYLGSGTAPSTEKRWLAYLMVAQDQRRAREFEAQFENLTTGAQWGWSYLSINELNYRQVVNADPKKVLVNPI